MFDRLSRVPNTVMQTDVGFASTADHPNRCTDGGQR
jgi:hypothetical protein